MREAKELYFKKFKEKPYIIGVLWNNPSRLIENIISSVKNGVKYNEYEMLSNKEKELYDKGLLLF